MPIMPIEQQSVHIVAASVGFLSLLLLWLTAIWGTLLRLGWGLTRVRHQTLYGVHQTMTLLGLAVSVLIQRRLGYHRWRMLHIGAYLGFTLLCAHVLISGSDTKSVWVRGLVGAAWLSTLLLRIVTTQRAATMPKRMAERMAARLSGRQVMVNVDPTHCVRFGFCEHEAPEVFQLRGDGRLTYRPAVPAGQVEQVIKAARVCPARAIVLSRAATTMVMSSERVQSQ